LIAATSTQRGTGHTLPSKPCLARNRPTGTNVERYAPDLWTDEFAFLSQPGQVEIQSDHVSVSRGRYDAQIYANNAQTLGQELSRDVSHSPAIQQAQGAHKIEPQTTHTNQIKSGFRSRSLMPHSRMTCQDSHSTR
jgi:hypothetical protein